MHVFVALPVAADDVVALLLESLCEVGGDKATRAGHADLQLLLGPVILRAILAAELKIVVACC